MSDLAKVNYSLYCIYMLLFIGWIPRFSTLTTTSVSDSIHGSEAVKKKQSHLELSFMLRAFLHKHFEYWLKGNLKPESRLDMKSSTSSNLSSLVGPLYFDDLVVPVATRHVGVMKKITGNNPHIRKAFEQHCQRYPSS